MRAGYRVVLEADAEAQQLPYTVRLSSNALCDYCSIPSCRLLARLPGTVFMNHRISFASAQPMSEKCGAGNTGTGERAASPTERICPDGSILPRNTLRKENEFFSWDVRLSRQFGFGRAARWRPSSTSST